MSYKIWVDNYDKLALLCDGQTSITLYCKNLFHVIISVTNAGILIIAEIMLYPLQSIFLGNNDLLLFMGRYYSYFLGDLVLWYLNKRRLSLHSQIQIIFFLTYF